MESNLLMGRNLKHDQARICAIQMPVVNILWLNKLKKKNWYWYSWRLFWLISWFFKKSLYILNITKGPLFHLLLYRPLTHDSFWIKLTKHLNFWTIRRCPLLNCRIRYSERESELRVHSLVECKLAPLLFVTVTPVSCLMWALDLHRPSCDPLHSCPVWALSAVLTCYRIQIKMRFLTRSPELFFTAMMDLQ